MRPPSEPVVCSSNYEIDVAVPYRLDLTVSVLRRLSANIVDVLTPDGQYIRAFDGFAGPVIARVAQHRPDSLILTLEGNVKQHPQAVALMHRMLGVDRELTRFNRAAARISWLRPLAARMRGVKPPRYATLWEACVNAIVFQQVSLQAASSILRKVIVAVGAPLTNNGSTFHAFPSVESVQAASEDLLLAAGLSGRKLAALRHVGDALLSGVLTEAMLEERASPDAIELLCRVKGIGPWTATVILLRGLGRLDVFPMNDSSVTRNFKLVAGSERSMSSRFSGNSVRRKACCTITCFWLVLKRVTTWAALRSTSEVSRTSPYGSVKLSQSKTLSVPAAGARRRYFRFAGNQTQSCS